MVAPAVVAVSYTPPAAVGAVMTSMPYTQPLPVAWITVGVVILRADRAPAGPMRYVAAIIYTPLNEYDMEADRISCLTTASAVPW